VSRRPDWREGGLQPPGQHGGRAEVNIRLGCQEGDGIAPCGVPQPRQRPGALRLAQLGEVAAPELAES
jgi:hypothetical protein